MKRTILFATYAVLLAFSGFASAAPSVGPFVIPPDSRGNFATYLRPVPTWTDVVDLTSSTNQSYTVPAGANFLVLSSNCSAFYVQAGGTATVPAANVTNGGASTLNPSGFLVTGGSSLGFISPTSCIVTIDVYQ